jgi:hypothetical protein
VKRGNRESSARVCDAVLQKGKTVKSPICRHETDLLRTKRRKRPEHMEIYQPLSMQMSDKKNEKKNHRDMRRLLDENGDERWWYLF